MSTRLLLELVEDEPYRAELELVDDTDAPQPLPAGELRMHLRESTGGPLVLDAGPYLTRAGEAVVLELPAAVTRTLPPALVGDLWIGDVRLVKLAARVDQSVTTR